MPIPAEEERYPMKIENFRRLPHDYDSRLTAILSEPVPADVIVSFYYVALLSPAANYRWELHQDGRLFRVRHSGKNITYENTFDKALPKRATKHLSQNDMRALAEEFDRADFFTQPGFQRRSPAEDGAYVVVRARRGDNLHDVVYENIENRLVNYLYSIVT